MICHWVPHDTEPLMTQRSVGHGDVRTDRRSTKAGCDMNCTFNFDTYSQPVGRIADSHRECLCHERDQ